MIICKPKPAVQFVLFALLAVVYGISFLLIGYIVQGQQSIWLYGGVLISLIVTFLFTIRVFIGHKSLLIDKGKISVKYLFRTYTFDIQAITSWEEIEIKTFNNQVFKQIDLVLENQKVSFSQQEHTDYDKLLQFLKKIKKQVKEKP
ncbi:MAG: hypothetical protein OHK0057_28550 [Thermoflexibacter sp.]